MADYKPSDLFLGVFEIFGILLPGSALIFLLDDFLSPLSAHLPFPISSYGWIAFLLAAYFAGQLLRSLEAPFEELYKRFRRRKLRNKRYETLRDLTQKKVLSRYAFNCDDRDLYYFAGSVVRAAIPPAAQELDRGGAEYKFFRSSVFVFFVAAVVLWRQTPIGSGISVVLAIFFCWEFLYLRWINELFTYQYFLVLHYSLEKGSSL